MAQSIEPNSVTNANVYINGTSAIGKASEIKIPPVTITTIERQGLGMQGKIKLPAGFSVLEGEITWNSYYPDVMRALGNPYRSVKLQARSSLETYDASGRTIELPLVTFITASFVELNTGSHKPSENSEYPSKFTATYLKQMVNGQPILELDYLNNIFRVNDEDLLATYRANIGG